MLPQTWKNKNNETFRSRSETLMGRRRSIIFCVFCTMANPGLSTTVLLGAEHRFSRTSQFFSICVASVAREWNGFTVTRGWALGISECTKCTQVARQLDHRSLRDVHKVQRFVCLNLRFIPSFWAGVCCVCCSLCLLMIVLNYILCLPLKDSFPLELWPFYTAASCGSFERFLLRWTRMEMGS